MGRQSRLSRSRGPGKVERSHRIDHEEFWGGHRLQAFGVTAGALRDWETRYIYERFALALKGRTPAENLLLSKPPRRVA
jgi:hypothetical protein